MTSPLPTFEERSDEEVWAYHQSHADAAAFHGERRSHAKAEILRRAAANNATALLIEQGMIKITLSDEYAFANAGVEGVFLDLIERAQLGNEWNANMSHEYRIKQPWLKRLRTLGDEWIEAIDAMTMAGKGSPTVTGPPLEDMKADIPDEDQEDEATEVPTI